MTHCIISLFITEKLFRLIINNFLICSGQFQRTCLDSLRSFRRITQDKYRFSKRWSLLLDSAAVCHDQITLILEIMEIKYFQWLDQANSVAVIKNFFCNLTYLRIHMDRIYNFHICKFIYDPFDRSENMVHWFTEIFSSMCSQKDHPVIPDPVKDRIFIIFINCRCHGIDCCISRNINIFFLFPFIAEILGTYLCRCKMHICKTSYHLTVHLLREW